MNIRLEHFYRGKLVRDGKATGDFKITRYSTGLDRDRARQYFDTYVSLGRYELLATRQHLIHAYSVFAHPDAILVTHARRGPVKDRDGDYYPDFHCIVVPRDLWTSLDGYFMPLFDLFDRELFPPLFDEQDDAEIPALEFSLIKLTPDAHMKVLGMLPDIEPRLIEGILTPLVTETTVVVRDAPEDPSYRLALCQALTLTLPSSLRPTMTFATEVFETATCKVTVKFLHLNGRPNANDAILRWLLPDRITAEGVPAHRYAEAVAVYAQDGAQILADALKVYFKSLEEIYHYEPRSSDALRVLGTLMLIYHGNATPDVIEEFLRSPYAQHVEKIQETCIISLVRWTVTHDQLERLTGIVESGQIERFAGGVEKLLLELCNSEAGLVAHMLVRGWVYGGRFQDKEFWRNIYQKLTFKLLAHLTEHAETDILLQFVERIRADIERYQLAGWYTKIIKILRQGTLNSKLTTEILCLSVDQFFEDNTGKSITDFLNDADLHTYLPEPVKMVCQILTTGHQTPPLETLTRAIHQLRNSKAAFWALLPWIVQHGPILLDKSAWAMALEYAGNNRDTHDYLRKYMANERQRSDESWIEALAVDPTALRGLLDTRVALGCYVEAARLVRAIEQRFALDRQESRNWLEWSRRAFAESPIIDAVAAERIFIELERLDIPSETLWHLILAALHHDGWRNDQLALFAAKQASRSPALLASIEIGDKLTRLICAAARQGNEKITEILLDHVLKITFQNIDSNARVKGIYTQAMALADAPKLRPLFHTRLRYQARALPLPDLEHLNKLMTDPQFNEEKDIIYALITYKRVFGDQTIGQFIEQIENLRETLDRFDKMFSADPHQTNQPNIDLSTFLEELQAQSRTDSLTPQQLEKFSKTLREVAEMMSRFGDERTREKTGLSTKWLKRETAEERLYSGAQTPRTVIDAIKWLSGVLRRLPESMR